MYIVLKIPECNEMNVVHKYARVDGISTFYNFFNRPPEFKIQTRIFSHQSKLIHDLKPKIDSLSLPYIKSGKAVLSKIGKIKDVKSIRRKRLYIKHKERIANSLLNPKSYLFFRKEFPDISTVPKNCKINSKGKFSKNTRNLQSR